VKNRPGEEGFHDKKRTGCVNGTKHRFCLEKATQAFTRSEPAMQEEESSEILVRGGKGHSEEISLGKWGPVRARRKAQENCREKTETRGKGESPVLTEGYPRGIQRVKGGSIVPGKRVRNISRNRKNRGRQSAKKHTAKYGQSKTQQQEKKKGKKERC